MVSFNSVLLVLAVLVLNCTASYLDDNDLSMSTNEDPSCKPSTEFSNYVSNTIANINEPEDDLLAAFSQLRVADTSAVPASVVRGINTVYSQLLEFRRYTKVNSSKIVKTIISQVNGNVDGLVENLEIIRTNLMNSANSNMFEPSAKQVRIYEQQMILCASIEKLIQLLRENNCSGNSGSNRFYPRDPGNVFSIPGWKEQTDEEWYDMITSEELKSELENPFNEYFDSDEEEEQYEEAQDSDSLLFDSDDEIDEEGTINLFELVEHSKSKGLSHFLPQMVPVVTNGLSLLGAYFIYIIFSELFQGNLEISMVKYLHLPLYMGTYLVAGMAFVIAKELMEHV